MVSDTHLRCYVQDNKPVPGSPSASGKGQAGFRDGGHQALAKLPMCPSRGWCRLWRPCDPRRAWQGSPLMVTISGLSECFLKEFPKGNQAHSYIHTQLLSLLPEYTVLLGETSTKRILSEARTHGFAARGRVHLKSGANSHPLSAPHPRKELCTWSLPFPEPWHVGSLSRPGDLLPGPLRGLRDNSKVNVYPPHWPSGKLECGR